MSENEPPCCEKCGDEYWLKDGMEPSKYCDPCAQEVVISLEARVAELEAEKQKSAQEWLHLDAANRTLIEENKRMRKYADAMAEGYISLALWAGERCPTTAGMYLKEFPREEAKRG